MGTLLGLTWLLTSWACTVAAVVRAPPTTGPARGFKARVYPTLLTPSRPEQPLGFAAQFGDGMVLQRGPAQAAVYGRVPNGSAVGSVVVSVTGGASYRVTAIVTGACPAPSVTPSPFLHLPLVPQTQPGMGR